MGKSTPQEIINRYVDSGIPASVWVEFPQSQIAHSVVVTGQVLAPKAPPTLPLRPTRAEYRSVFLMNDDQQGPNLRLPSTSSCSIGDVQHNVQDNTIRNDLNGSVKQIVRDQSRVKQKRFCSRN